MKISVVVPIYNEESKLKHFLMELSSVEHQIVLVDDGSTDGSYDIVKAFKKRNKKLAVLRHDVNLGKGEALRTGCDFAFKNGAEGVIIMDSDGQHMPADIKLIVSRFKKGGCGIVFGARVFKGDIPLERFLYNKFASIAVNILYGTYISDVLCGFRGFTKESYAKIRWKTGGYSVDAEMIVRAIKSKLKFCEVGVETVYYEKYKGVSVKESFEIFLHLIYWKIFGI